MDDVSWLTEQGWDVLPDSGLDDEPSDMVLTSGEQVAVLTDGFRLRLLGSVSHRPGSAKELAARFGVPTTRLYHHLGLLEEHDFIRVVATRRSGARTERCYGSPPRRSMRPGGALVDGEDGAAFGTALRGLAEVTGATLEAAALAGVLTVPRDREEEATTRHVVSWLTARLTREQQLAHAAALVELTKRVVADSVANAEVQEGGQRVETEPVAMFVALAPDVVFPTVGPEDA